MKQVRKSLPLPIPVIRALHKLGRDIRDARRRRRIPSAILAERASISRTTLNKIEKGDAGVYIGNYAAVLFSLGLVDRIAALADGANDRLGRALERSNCLSASAFRSRGKNESLRRRETDKPIAWHRRSSTRI